MASIKSYTHRSDTKYFGSCSGANAFDEIQIAKQNQKTNHQQSNSKKVQDSIDSQCTKKFKSMNKENFPQSQQTIGLQMENQFKDSTDDIPCKTASIFIERINNFLCFNRTNRQTNEKLLGLIDMRIRNNFISRKNVKHGKILKLKKPTFIETILGKFEIFNYVKVNIFSHDLNFLIVDSLEQFDIVLGFDGLSKINASMDLFSMKLTYSIKKEIKLNEKEKLQNDLIEKEKAQVDQKKITERKFEEEKIEKNLGQNRKDCE